MLQESSRSRIWVVVGICGLLFFAVLGAGFVGISFYRNARRGVIEIQNADAACRSWLLTDPQITQELGSPTLGYSMGSVTATSGDEDHGAAQFQYGIGGPKSRGDIQVWLNQSPGGRWAVIGAVLSRAGQAPLKIGMPPEPTQATGKAN